MNAFVRFERTFPSWMESGNFWREGLLEILWRLVVVRRELGYIYWFEKIEKGF